MSKMDKMEKPHVAAIIQARMGSTRLPGKVLMPIAGRPLLWHIVYRLRKCRNVDQIVIATSDKPGDDSLMSFATEHNITLVRGSEDNVLQRFALAADKVEADVIVRICGDSPLVDPVIIDRQIETLLRESADHCGGKPGFPSIHEGFSAFSRQALNRLLTEAAHDPAAIEHVTAYFKNHPESFSCARIELPEEHRFQGARMSVDTPADLQFMNELYRRLGVPAGEADMADVVRLLNEQPDLLQINAHIYQKKIRDKTHKIFIRCDGDSRVGMGHVVRCLALADELRESHGCGVTFAVATGEPGIKQIQDAGFPVKTRPDDLSEQQWMDGFLDEIHPQALVLDIRNDLPREKVRQWRKSGVLIVTIDDPSGRRLESDLAFYPPVPQVQEMDWTGFTGKLFVGWEWVLLRKQFATARSQRSDAGRRASDIGSRTPRILVTMGGSDPAGLTLKAVQALQEVKSPFHATIILGPAFAHDVELQELLKNIAFPYTILRNVKDMAAIMKKADFAIASFGGIAYELAASGTPGIYLALTENHARSAGLFQESGKGINLGVYNMVKEQEIVYAVENLLQNTSLQNTFKKYCLEKMDGQGAKRIAKTISENMRNQI